MVINKISPFVELHFPEDNRAIPLVTPIFVYTAYFLNGISGHTFPCIVSFKKSDASCFIYRREENKGYISIGSPDSLDGLIGEFGHEMCHYTIKNPSMHNSSATRVLVSPFEELVCELVACRQLDVAARHFGKIPSYREYAHALASIPLRKAVRAQLLMPPGKTTSEAFRGLFGRTGELSALDYAPIQALSLEVYELFSKNPDLWDIIRLLHNAPQSLSLENTLQYLLDSAERSYQESLRKFVSQILS